MILQYFGLEAFFRIVTQIFFIYLTFWGLQTLNLTTLFRRKANQTRQIHLVFIFLSIAIGYNVSNFFLEFIMLFKNMLHFGI